MLLAGKNTKNEAQLVDQRAGKDDIQRQKERNAVLSLANDILTVRTVTSLLMHDQSNLIMQIKALK